LMPAQTYKIAIWKKIPARMTVERLNAK
jgi:hypothetical protein